MYCHCTMLQFYYIDMYKNKLRGRGDDRISLPNILFELLITIQWWLFFFSWRFFHAKNKISFQTFKYTSIINFQKYFILWKHTYQSIQNFPKENSLSICKKSKETWAVYSVITNKHKNKQKVVERIVLLCKHPKRQKRVHVLYNKEIYYTINNEWY